MSLQMSGVKNNIFHSYIETTLQSPKLYINLYLKQLKDNKTLFLFSIIQFTDFDQVYRLRIPHAPVRPVGVYLR